MTIPIDWSAFKDPPCTTCYCRCGATYRAHAKTVMVNGVWKAISKTPCPKCGKVDDIRRVSTDPESFTIRG